MMKIEHNPRSVAVLLCFFACVLGAAIAAALLLHGRQNAAPAQTPLPLTPIFFNTLGYLPYTVNIENGPQFSYTVTNPTHKEMHLADAYCNAVLVLDGKAYPSHRVWLDDDTLKPGNTWTDTIELRNYLPGAEQPEGKWHSAALADGTHTLAYHMGGKTYGPITFIWQSQPTP